LTAVTGFLASKVYKFLIYLPEVKNQHKSAKILLLARRIRKGGREIIREIKEINLPERIKILLLSL
jgi:hypothetical protein